MTKYEQINRRYEKLFYPKVRKVLKAKVSSLTGIIEREGIQAGVSHLNNNLGDVEMNKLIRVLYVTVGIRHANEATRYLRRQKGFGFSEFWTNFINEYLRKHLLDAITFKVNETFRDTMLRRIQQAITEGWGIDKTVRTLEELPITETQAARIVRTEVNTASNVGVMAAGQTYDYEMMKKWISVRDARTRGVDPEDHASHVLLNETIVDFDDVFTDPRNGDKLRHPGDPEAKAESIINCRCNMVLVPKRDSNGRLIPKSRISVVRSFNRDNRVITI